MGKSQRTKGAAGEREFAKLIGEYLNIECRRNLEQTRSGGADLLGVGPWAIEVKRQERLCIPAWWEQACDQAGDAWPALAYRQSRQPWTVVVPLHSLTGRPGASDYHRAALSLEAFCDYTREILDEYRTAS